MKILEIKKGLKENKKLIHTFGEVKTVHFDTITKGRNPMLKVTIKGYESSGKILVDAKKLFFIK